MTPRAGPIRFGPFDVTSQVFYTTPHTFAVVNLKPLLPGHILICPHHGESPPPPARLTQLSQTQTIDLFSTVRRLTPTLTRLHSATALNIAIQDGEAAGQSVPHLHVHVIPRRMGDMDGRGGGDRIYEMMEKGVEGDIGAHFRERGGGEVVGAEEGKAKQERRPFSDPDAEERKPRSEGEMRAEAEMLRRELSKDGIYSTPPLLTPAGEEGEGAEASKTATTAEELYSTIDWRAVLTNIAWMVTGYAAASWYKNRNNSRRPR